MGNGFYKILPRLPLPKGGADEVGNKAWNLMRMTAAGLPVPAGFVLPTDWCRGFDSDRTSEELDATLSSGIAALEAATGLVFGSPRRPLLVSVRSGAALSMPGMMETVLDVGINDEVVGGLIGDTGNPRLAWDCYRRLVQGYAAVVAQLPRAPFDELIAQAVAGSGIQKDSQLDYAALRSLTRGLLTCYREHAGVPFPQDPREQLKQAALAVLRSWDAPKAISYRHANKMKDSAGTAVTVQRMVFGNTGGASGAGVAFTRNPNTGTRELYLDFEFNAQGEDVVGGRIALSGEERLRRTLPSTCTQLEQATRTLETLFRDAQDFEFTVQQGKLYLLQSRAAKRTDWAALHIAVDQVEEGLITQQEAFSHLEGIDLSSVVRTRFKIAPAEPLAHAQVASMGVACGAIALDAKAALSMAQADSPVILVRHDTETEDIDGIMRASGILTASGGRTSHAAVVARQLGKVCLVACPDLEIDLARRCCRVGRANLREGEFLSLDGNSGSIYSGKLDVIAERPEVELAKIAGWRGASLCSPSCAI